MTEQQTVQSCLLFFIVSSFLSHKVMLLSAVRSARQRKFILVSGRDSWGVKGSEPMGLVVHLEISNRTLPSYAQLSLVV